MEQGGLWLVCIGDIIRESEDSFYLYYLGVQAIKSPRPQRNCWSARALRPYTAVSKGEEVCVCSCVCLYVDGGSREMREGPARRKYFPSPRTPLTAD